MRLGVPKESRAGERRVALIPDSVKSLTAKGLEVVVESGGPVLVSTPCASDMGPVLDAYFQDQVRESADGSSPQTVMTSATIELPARSECPRVLMAVPAGGENVVYRYRASLVNPPRPPALVRCR